MSLEPQSHEEWAPKLVHMANQIGTFFGAQPGDHAVADIAEHIEKFWDPRMRSRILAYLEAGGAGLDPLVRRALEKVAAIDARKRTAAAD